MSATTRSLTNIAIGLTLIIWTWLTAAMLLTGNGFPFPGSEYSLAALMAWCFLNMGRR